MDNNQNQQPNGYGMPQPNMQAGMPGQTPQPGYGMPGQNVQPGYGMPQLSLIHISEPTRH